MNATMGRIYGSDANRFPWTRDEVDSIPYAQMSVKIGYMPAGMLLLTALDGETCTWSAANDVRIVTRMGRVVQTQGLLENIVTLHPEVPTLAALNITAPVDTVGTVRISNVSGGARNGTLHSRLYPASAPTQLALQGTDYQVREIVEDMSVPELQWKTTQRYWLDANGNFRSVSFQPTPGTPHMQMDLLKAPRRA